MGKAPCLDCNDRQPGCHGRCGRYQVYDAANKKRRAELLEVSAANEQAAIRSHRAYKAMKNRKRL